MAVISRVRTEARRMGIQARGFGARGINNAAAKASRFLKEVKLGMRITFGGGMVEVMVGGSLKGGKSFGIDPKKSNRSLLFFKANSATKQIAPGDFSLEEEKLITDVASKVRERDFYIGEAIRTIRSRKDIATVFKGLSQQGRALFFLCQTIEGRASTLDVCDAELLASLILELSLNDQLAAIWTGITSEDSDLEKTYKAFWLFKNKYCGDNPTSAAAQNVSHILAQISKCWGMKQ